MNKKILVLLTLLWGAHCFPMSTPVNSWSKKRPVEDYLSFNCATRLGMTPVRSALAMYSIGLPAAITVSYLIHKKRSKEPVSWESFKEDSKVYVEVFKAICTPWKEDSRELIAEHSRIAACILAVPVLIGATSVGLWAYRDHQFGKAGLFCGMDSYNNVKDLLRGKSGQVSFEALEKVAPVDSEVLADLRAYGYGTITRDNPNEMIGKSSPLCLVAERLAEKGCSEARVEAFYSLYKGLLERGADVNQQDDKDTEQIPLGAVLTGLKRDDLSDRQSELLRECHSDLLDKGVRLDARVKKDGATPFAEVLDALGTVPESRVSSMCSLARDMVRKDEKVLNGRQIDGRTTLGVVFQVLSKPKLGEEALSELRDFGREIIDGGVGLSEPMVPGGDVPLVAATRAMANKEISTESAEAFNRLASAMIDKKVVLETQGRASLDLLVEGMANAELETERVCSLSDVARSLLKEDKVNVNGGANRPLAKMVEFFTGDPDDSRVKALNQFVDDLIDRDGIDVNGDMRVGGHNISPLAVVVKKIVEEESSQERLGQLEDLAGHLLRKGAKADVQIPNTVGPPQGLLETVLACCMDAAPISSEKVGVLRGVVVDLSRAGAKLQQNQFNVLKGSLATCTQQERLPLFASLGLAALDGPISGQVALNNELDDLTGCLGNSAGTEKALVYGKWAAKVADKAKKENIDLSFRFQALLHSIRPGTAGLTTSKRSVLFNLAKSLMDKECVANPGKSLHDMQLLDVDAGELDESARHNVQGWIDAILKKGGKLSPSFGQILDSIRDGARTTEQRKALFGLAQKLAKKGCVDFNKARKLLLHGAIDEAQREEVGSWMKASIPDFTVGAPVPGLKDIVQMIVRREAAPGGKALDDVQLQVLGDCAGAIINKARASSLGGKCRNQILRGLTSDYDTCLDKKLAPISQKQSEILGELNTRIATKDFGMSNWDWEVH